MTQHGLLPEHIPFMRRAEQSEPGFTAERVEFSANLNQICHYCKAPTPNVSMVYVFMRDDITRFSLGFHMCRDFEACDFRKAVAT